MPDHFPKGAEWRIWDLQVHTPFSVLNNGFGDDLENYAKQFFRKAVNRSIAVVGVADYFIVDGYKYLKELQADDNRLKIVVGEEYFDRAKKIKLFANVELRTNVLVNESRVNYHVIFSDEVSPDEISEDFLAQLSFTSEGVAGELDQKESLTKRNLERLGKRLKEQHAKFLDRSDLFIGMMQATIDLSDVATVLNRQKSKFAGKFFLCVPCDEDLSKIKWDGQGHLTRKVMIQKSHALVSSNPKTREFALGATHNSLEEFIAEFGQPKPCIHSSDAHTFEQLFEPDQERYTWIKADPTFRGLLQVLNEPESRVYVGLCPPSLISIKSRPTKVLREVAVNKKADSTYGETWFDSKISLNPELIAIIGNKGSGKSALADILGLIGNTPRYEKFSFLSPTRFCERKTSKARHFEASATWCDEEATGPVSLDSIPEEGSVELVKYIPQDYLESICNEVSRGRGSKFYDELQHVIFSHVPVIEQLGFPTLDSLLEHRSEENKKAIDFLIDELKGINRALTACEAQLTTGYRSRLNASLVEKKREIEAHEQSRPIPQSEPSADPATAELTEAVSKKIADHQGAISLLDDAITQLTSAQKNFTSRRVTAERLLGKVSNLERQVTSLKADAIQDLEDLGLTWDDLVKFDVSKAKLDEILGEAKSQVEGISSMLNASTPEGPVSRKSQLEADIAALTLELSAPQRAFEAHKALVRAWEQDKAALIGDTEQPGSLANIEHQIAQLPALQETQGDLRQQQISKAKEIFQAKVNLRDDYKKYYGAVQNFLAEHPLAQSQQFKLAFNVAITEQNFSTSFLKNINQRRVGSFSGSEEGAELLKKLLESTDFDSEESLIGFLGSITDALEHDQREGRGHAKIELEDQLASGTTITDMYDFIFSLTYLEPVYNLRWDGKTLEQLSPGERGNLLLIFYLLIDRDDIPLIIDQPEENLDNNTVYKILVPCVKEAKKRRQIIIVTHNPNLAVVCDAEQIICADMRKDDGNKITYISGSIENPLINKKIIDILEGTRPAFDKRDAKYIDGN